MAIKIEYDRICIGSFVLCEDANGVAFDGKACANQFCDPRKLTFQGIVSGYSSGGDAVPGTNIIDKFSFLSDAPATDVGNLSQGRRDVVGQSSLICGYTSGGRNPSPPIGFCNRIDKFPFASDTNATTVGVLSVIRGRGAGQSSCAHGYTSGGTGCSPAGGLRNEIDKFPFSSDTNASDVGNITIARENIAGQSSTISGYSSGGGAGPGFVDTIDKFPFATDSNATDVGELSQTRCGNAGQSSTESGYTSGGFIPSETDTVDKFPFATDSNATDVGELSQVRQLAAGQSSTVNGYTSGGFVPFISDTIDKFPFSSDASATDVGELSCRRVSLTGQQA